jgi:hypothetical protein
MVRMDATDGAWFERGEQLREVAGETAPHDDSGLRRFAMTLAAAGLCMAAFVTTALVLS